MYVCVSCGLVKRHQPQSKYCSHLVKYSGQVKCSYSACFIEDTLAADLCGILFLPVVVEILSQAKSCYNFCLDSRVELAQVQTPKYASPNYESVLRKVCRVKTKIHTHLTRLNTAPHTPH